MWKGGNAIRSSKLKIGTRLGLSVGLLLLLLFVVGGVGYWGVVSISGTTYRVIDEDAHIAEHAGRMRANIVGMRRFEKDVFLNIGGPARVEEYFGRWNGELNDVEGRVADLEKIVSTEEDRRNVRFIRDNLALYAAGFNMVYARILDGTLKTPSAANAAVDAFKEATYRMESTAEAFARKGNDRMDAAKPLVEAKTRGTQVALALLGILAILILADNLAYGIGAVRAFERQRVLNEELNRSREQLRELAREIQTAREEERTAVAREIHDALGQELTVLKMEVAWLERRLPEEQASLRDKARSIKESIDAAIGTVRRISSELRPGVLDHLGIAAALAWQGKAFGDRTGIACAVAAPERAYGLDRERETAVFRIFQEALTNVARHAGADRVDVKLSEERGELVLTVADNGKGISGESMANPGSLGLIGMRERIRPFDGTVEIRGVEGAGTTLTVRVPTGGKETAA